MLYNFYRTCFVVQVGMLDTDCPTKNKFRSSRAETPVEHTLLDHERNHHATRARYTEYTRYQLRVSTHACDKDKRNLHGTQNISLQTQRLTQNLRKLEDFPWMFKDFTHRAVIIRRMVTLVKDVTRLDAYPILVQMTVITLYRAIRSQVRYTSVHIYVFHWLFLFYQKYCIVVDF